MGCFAERLSGLQSQKTFRICQECMQAIRSKFYLAFCCHDIELGKAMPVRSPIVPRFVYKNEHLCHPNSTSIIFFFFLWSCFTSTYRSASQNAVFAQHNFEAMLPSQSLYSTQSPEKWAKQPHTCLDSTSFDPETRQLSQILQKRRGDHLPGPDAAPPTTSENWCRGAWPQTRDENSYLTWR